MLELVGEALIRLGLLGILLTFLCGAWIIPSWLIYEIWKKWRRDDAA